MWRAHSGYKRADLHDGVDDISVKPSDGHTRASMKEVWSARAAERKESE